MCKVKRLKDDNMPDIICYHSNRDIVFCPHSHNFYKGTVGLFAVVMETMVVGTTLV